MDQRVCLQLAKYAPTFLEQICGLDEKKQVEKESIALIKQNVLFRFSHQGAWLKKMSALYCPLQEPEKSNPSESPIDKADDKSSSSSDVPKEPLPISLIIENKTFISQSPTLINT